MNYLDEHETAALRSLVDRMVNAAEDLATDGATEHAGLLMAARRSIRLLATRLTAPVDVAAPPVEPPAP